MAVDTNLAWLFEKLKVEDPWLPPRTWESIPSQSGPLPPPRTSTSFPSSSSVSEGSLVRLALNALQGVQSALISIEKLSAAFSSDPADRTFHRIPSLWNRSSSTHALGRILKSIGCLGSLVFLLHKFVDHFTNLNLDDKSNGKKQENHELEENENDSELRRGNCFAYSLVNQAFAVAVRKVLEGYTCALDTLCASVGLRRSSKSIDLPLHASSGLGCLSSVVHSELTLLEVYLHTKELRTQIEALGNICELHDVALCFLVSSFEDLNGKATLGFNNFYRGGDLLTYLYSQLKVADPAHRALLKFLFLRSFEPYCGFIRSWIFKAEISDPYKEFIVEYVDGIPPYSHCKAGMSLLANVRERDGASVPCFLKKFLIPLVRAGQQLQVLMKLLELCNHAAPGDHTYADLLPCWSGFLSNNPFYASPVTFSKRDIEAMVIARNSYYERMQEKLEIILRKLEFCCEQVDGDYAIPILCANGGGSLNSSVSFMLDDRAVGNMDFDDHSTQDELSCVVDAFESSECSSISGSDDKTESERLIEFPNSLIGLKQNYFSALSFFMSTPIDNSLQKCLQIEKLCHTERISNDPCKGTGGHGHFMHSEHNGTILSDISMPLVSGESSWPFVDVQYADSPPGKCWPLGGLLRNPFYVDEGYIDEPRVHQSDSGPKLTNKNMGFIEKGMTDFSRPFATDSALIEESRGENELENGSSTSNLFALQQWKVNYHCNFLSMNPMLTKSALFNLMSKPGERSSRDHRQSIPCFDFSSVDDPCKVYMEKLAAGSMHELFEDSSAPVTSGKSDHHAKQGYGGDDVLIEDTEVSYGHLHLELKDYNQEDAMSTNVSGGSGWESLLGVSNNSDTNITGDLRHSFSSMFEIPIDFAIDKCLLQEILLQYNYVSKLTIKLLEDGFDLQEHLLALRRYHFMELADWADLFIMSLWHHKWCVTEADQRVAEIQGLLELSVQRSSCERDCYKDRLFVYTKGHGMMPLSTSAIGLHSFDFLGLGYRVDWPISIILTPGALKIYADIFSFLIQVKLAVFSLTDVWCSLKDLMHLISQNRHSALHEQELCRFSVLMKLRHQVNHFVSTLQQYVQSHLSHVSWCKFLHSLKHKVKDMMDIESVHMAYLTESLHICFLSDETWATASIIESILQCALDFRSCLTGGIWDVGLGQGDLLGELSRINISQVLAIKQKFDKNLKELHIYYLKSPKHGEFGLSRFWGYLNYNEYYSDVGNEMSHYAFVV